MNIIIGKTSGFCYGVKNTVYNANKELEKSKEKIYCLGELIHNKDITQKFKEKGLIFIDDINEAKGKTLIRAHGVEKEIYEIAKRKNIELIDLTCPNVLKIHNIVKKYYDDGFFIIIVGKKDHPEVIGTQSYCRDNSVVISNVYDTEQVIENLKASNCEKVLVISQTTYSLKSFDEIVKKIKENLPETIKLDIKNTICLATEKRQLETEKISKSVDFMIIIGGKNSSNTNKLYEISCKNCKNVIFAENAKDIDKDKVSQFENIGVMAGASTPQESIDEVLNLLEN